MKHALPTQHFVTINAFSPTKFVMCCLSIQWNNWCFWLGFVVEVNR